MSLEKNSFGGALTALSLRRPISIIVCAVAVILLSVFSLIQTPEDILPNLNVPAIYVAQAYGGMAPAQMESFVTSLYESLFLFVSGVEHIESKSIQSIGLIKIQFQPGTNMAEALAQVINYVNRARASLPPGTVPPFIMRFDAGSQPVGDLVFTSDTRSLAELQNYALNYVRPSFATLPGVSAAAPFGANSKAIVVSLDPAKLRKYSVSADDVAEAVLNANQVTPSGNLPMGDSYPMVSINSPVDNIQELQNVPLRLGTSPTVLLKDVGTIQVGADIQTGYALVNGHRTIYIPVTKRAEASTLAVVDEVKANLKHFQDLLPPDIKVSYEFDQSGYVRRAIGSLIFEGLMGALLTGLMVLLFLQDWRSALIVVMNIPLAIMGSLFALWLTGQTINIMTLGGLALAIGILVDETTVTIENIHTHMSRGSTAARSALEATTEIFIPKLFTLLCFLIVFTPAFFMSGIPRSLFIPLALAVGFALISSFFLSTTFVPVLSTLLLPDHKKHPGAHQAPGQPKHVARLVASQQVKASAKKELEGFDAFRARYAEFLKRIIPFRIPLITGYLTISLLLVGLLFAFFIGREIFPQVDEGQFQVRMRAPTGTGIDKTEADVLQFLAIVKKDAGGDGMVRESVSYAGAQSYNLVINAIYLWTSGPQDAVIDVALDPKAHVRLADFREQLRKDVAAQMPDVTISFEPSSLVERMMSSGAATPVEVMVSGNNFDDVKAYAAKVMDGLKTIPVLRDLGYGQAMDYPTLNVNVNRERAGFQGFSLQRVSNSLVPATSSSRFTLPSYWADETIGTSFVVQVQVPQGAITQVSDLKRLPVSINEATLPLGDVASITATTTRGEIDRYNQQRTMDLTANLSGLDMGRASLLINKVLDQLKAEKPRGVTVAVRGQIQPLNQMFIQLSIGLVIALVVVLLLLAMNFESVSLAFIVLSTAPAVLLGVALILFATGTTLNIESYMGTIMSVGVAVANAILLVTFAEKDRLEQGDSVKAAIEGAQSRLRPILMTSFAMLAGMVPMALGLTEGGQQTAPLGRAVIGGLGGATIATLTLLPLIFAIVQKRKTLKSPSLHPDDKDSAHYDGRK